MFDLLLQHLCQHAEADTHAQREQALLGGVHQLAERLLNFRRERELARLLTADDLDARYGAHGVPPVSWTDFALATVAPRPDEAGGPPPAKFYGLRDKLLAGARITELTWFLGPGYLERFEPSAPFAQAPVSKIRNR
jgi:hypothetical protein